MQILSINSGSNGNAYYFGNDQDAILIDAGLSCKQIEKRIIASGLSMEKVKAVFITHEHSDHVFGLRSLLKKFRIPVYISKNTLEASNLNLPEESIQFFESKIEISIGKFTITPFPIHHDAADPHGFYIIHAGMSAGIFNDVGHVCDQVKYYFSKCDAAFLECNYDEELLENGSYPKYLKERIKGPKGHLSNIQALELFKSHRSPRLKHLWLSHLSKENNDPERVKSLFEQERSGVSLLIAERNRQGPVIDLNRKNQTKRNYNLQLELF